MKSNKTFSDFTTEMLEDLLKENEYEREYGFRIIHPKFQKTYLYMLEAQRITILNELQNRN